MAEHNNKQDNKKRLAIRIVFGCIAVISLAIMVLISPFGKRLLGNEAQTEALTFETIAGDIPTKAVTVPKNTDSTLPSVSVSVPDPTQPTTNPYKNYSVLINTYKFTYSEEQGITTAIGKENEDVKMTITPKADVSYTDLCNLSKELYGAAQGDKKLQMTNPNACYSSEKDGIVTTVYCIDDGNDGSIEIKYQYPTDNSDYEKEFDFMISMFRVEN